MRANRVITSRLARSLATLVALSAAAVDAEARASGQADPATFEAMPRDIEERIVSLVRRWFAALEDPTTDPEKLNGLLAEEPFELILDGGALRDRDELFAWVSKLRATYPRIEYRLDPIRIHPEGRDRYRIRFEFDRNAIDEAGQPHVARREHSWIVRGDANATPVILSIEERPLLFFPGTGPQIVCY